MTGPDLCMVSAEGGSAFMAELLDVVADTVRRVGGRARTAVGKFPDPEPDTVYVVVPHEYFVVTPDAHYPSAELCRRTIGFCVEHPGTATFERSAGLVGSLAAAVDINETSAAELRARGIDVELFQLGYSPLWDAWGGDPDSPRDIDVTYLGTAERRRSVLLGSYAQDLEGLDARLLTPPHEMMDSARVDFLPGKAKHEHLARSRFLLNLHREQKQTLEWVRTLEAMCNGAVVVSEPATEVEPLVPGEHLVLARSGSLGAVVAALAEEPERERGLRQAAYEFVKRLDTARSARTLVELAATVLDGRATPPPVAVESARALAGALRSPENALAIDTPSWDVRFEGDRTVADPAAPAASGAAGRTAQQAATARLRAERHWVPAATGRLFADAERVDVDVLIVRRPGEVDPDDLVNDILVGTVLPKRVLVCEDGVVPLSKPRPVDLLTHAAPMGRGVGRNALLARSSAEWLLVLDGGTRASRFLLERFWSATGSADVVHCPVGDPVDGLVGALPPEDRRLRTIPYLGSGYLVRRAVVDRMGGWSEDPHFDGLEDHVFWRAVAAGGVASALVQQVLLRRTRPDPPARPLDLDPRRVWAAVTAQSEGRKPGE
ncbi:glycosyltransferase family protein [Actinokineospora iranica]|uniref:Glycosyl transferases group 1 n=1 Tax=Actinokineospora iranica TaxID=1271860 RepID=A0A1G6PCP7_9PSEU|nr:glycosyltransferase [Actinokineospora iranica]SDC78022.1 Glycosyl transferases group 1 [Actinokineospora iranica]